MSNDVTTHADSSRREARCWSPQLPQLFCVHPYRNCRLLTYNGWGQHHQASSSRLDKPRKTVPLSIVPTRFKNPATPDELCWELREDWRMRALRFDSSVFPLSLILLVSFSRPFNNVLYTPPSFFPLSAFSPGGKLSIRPAGTLRVDRSNSSDT